MFKVSRIFLLLVLSSTVSSQKMFRNGSEIDCQRIPFAFRCTNGELVERCSFNAFCEDYRNLTSGTKIRLTVLFASFCFYSQKFIIETLYPKVYQNFKDYVDIELVPFGNANRTEDGKINCKLGEEECQAHLTITCAQKYLKDAIPFVYCLEKSFKRQRSNNGTVEKCYGQTEIVEETQAKLEQCTISEEGYQLQQADANRTESAWPDWAESAPWIVINNLSLKSFQQVDLVRVLCDFYLTAPDRPEICQH